MQPLDERDLQRLLCGPGPSNAHPRVAAATGLPLVGHLDPVFSTVLDEIAAGLRTLFGTANAVTFAASGTGTAGMELLAMNLVEPGDTVVVGQNGVFGGRIREACAKLGAHVVAVEAPWGTAIDPAALRAAIGQAERVDLVWCVHAETSTGVWQPDVAALSAAAHEREALFLLDAVTSLGGVPVEMDAWGVDAAFSGSQKCLGVTPGLAPVSLNERALAKFRARRTPVPSWYLDLTKLLGYWQAADGRRTYHHTAPIAPLYGLHEALRLLLDEGPAAAVARTAAAATELAAGLEARGFRSAVAEPEHRLPQLHCVRPPAGVDEATLRRELWQRHRIEIGGGLGALAGQAVRIGLMGHNARPATVERLLAAIDEVLA